MFHKKSVPSNFRKGIPFIIVIFVVMLAGVAWFVPGAPHAEAAVSNVVLADNDTTGYGLDGRDFSVTWTPGDSPAGYVGTKIYILPAAVAASVTTGNVATNGCSGNACQDRGIFFQQSQSSHTLPQFEQNDSVGTAWSAATSYKACILIDATTDELTCSAAGVSPTSDSPSDANRPFIDHAAVHSAQGGVDAVILAFVFDDQTTSTEFTSPTVDAVQYFKLFYGANVASSETATNGAQVDGKLFKFIVPAASVPAAGGTFQYYLSAKDKSANTTFFCANPNAATAAECKSSPIVVNTVAAGSRTIAGTISGLNAGVTTALSGAYVFPAGFAKDTTTTNGSGAYTLSGIPNNEALDISAYKSGYCMNKRFEVVGTGNLTGINMNLNQGECGFSGAGGPGAGTSGAPAVLFSGPSEGSSSVPLTEKLRVGLNQSMNANTVNDADASNAGSNVYLTTDDGTTKVAGSVVYCASSASPGCSALFSQDQNTILFSPSSDLTVNIFYTLVVTEGVTNTAGQSIQGNRAGGGHRISFTTGGAVMNSSTVTTNFGDSGQYMPPYVKSMNPGPGVSAPTATNILLEFSERLNTATITTTNIQLWNKGTGVQVSLSSSDISVDPNEQRFVTINPASNLAAGDYEVRVKGAVASASGMSLMPPSQATSNAFVSQFTVSTSATAPAPTIYPGLTSGSTGVAVNSGSFEFGFTQQLSYTSISSTNITLKRGSTTISADVKYNPSRNGVFVMPQDVLAPNTTYTITFGTGVTSLAGTALASEQNFTYTTGSADTTAPKLREVRCDDYTCTAFFTEPMNHDTQADSDFAGSVLNHANITLTQGGADKVISSTPITYDSEAWSITVKGVALTAGGGSFIFTAAAATEDVSDNGIDGTARTFTGSVENSANTFGSFGDTGMFAPPTSIAGGGTAAFKPEGFGSFSAEQFAFGQAATAYPFNNMAGKDSNVFQVRFGPGIALQNDDQVVLTFPSGTTITNAVPDTFSPFYNDMNGSGSVTAIFDTAYDTDGVGVDATARTVTVQLNISGTPGTSDQYTIDLRKITNPSIPKGPETGGYTLGIKVVRAGTTLVNKTSMPYFIMTAGERSITVNIYAGSQASPTAGANGNIFLHGGGPTGPMDKNVTLTNGIISSVDGTAASSIQYTNLNDGCYFLGTDPFVTLGGNDYFGQMSPEPVCVSSSASSVTKNIVLTSSSGSASVPLTVKFSGIASFNSTDVDIFAGGPGRFVVKTLSALGAPDANGYTIRLPQDGTWFVGVGPAMPKSASSKVTTMLPGIPPPPIELAVSGVGGASPAISAGRNAPAGASFNDATDTVTFTFATADKTVSGQVTDGNSGLASVQVFMHSQGFGAPVFTTTDASGNFTISMSDYGAYEIGAFKDGLPPMFQPIEVQPDNTVTPADAGTAPDIIFKGKLITGDNPLVLKLKKGTYSISGKVLDAASSGNGIANASVFANDTAGNFVGGNTDSSGNYTLFVDAGTWTIRSELPPDKTDICGTLSTTQTITTESKSSVNLTPSTATCVELSGTITVGGSVLANAPVFIDEWDATNSKPITGGFFKGTSTNSSGVYAVKVVGNKTYRVGTFDPNNGEIATTATVAGSDVLNAHITATTGTITFAFTGGTSSMNAFAEVKNSTNSTLRRGQQKNGLDTNLTMSVPAGTYNYFVDVFGFGKFTGQVATGSTATIDVSTSSFVSLSGNVKDGNAAESNNLKGVLVTATDTTTGLVATALTDSSGNYTINVKTGTYKVSSALSGYVPSQASATVSISGNTSNYDFGGASGDQTALAKAGNVIRGTVYQSDGSTAMSEGSVTATESSTNLAVTAPIDPQNGSYSLSVTNGTWTVSAKGPKHAKTTRSGTVTIAGADSTGNNLTLTADASRTPKSDSKSIAANTGGSLDDSDNSGIKLTAGAGVLATGSSNVTVEVEKNYNAPDTSNFIPLGDVSFDISATGSSGAIKDLSGNADIHIEYTDLMSSLPSGVSESNLKLAYYSSERGEYVPVEDGFTIDTTNNVITAQTDHFTTFGVVYGSSVSVASTTTSGVTSPEDLSGSSPSVYAYNAPVSTSTPTPTPTPAAPSVPTSIPTSPSVSTPSISKPISEMTREEIVAKIAELQALVAKLQQELQALKQGSVLVGIPVDFSFSNDLKYGMRSDEVKYLQIILKAEVGDPIYPANVPAGGWFGTTTKNSVIAFQEKYAQEILAPWGFTKGTGLVGKTTRAKLNTLLGAQ
ncbi:MAG: carboxypeptidase regulatory-like domain-containing protein [Candidatus Wildermuthbacteria bacterium]|nr:carboxypeptidase regulatory-like domain-containing protein [Candidatus Wildermuthbacteria bacterium]